MKRFYFASLFCVAITCACTTQNIDTQLVFDASHGEQMSLTLPGGQVVNYTAYTNLYYVENVEDSTYQYMNIFVPDGATQQSPIFMPNGVGGYMASRPSMIDANGASGRALAEGFVVAIAGARGRNSTVQHDGKTIYTGRAPKALLDLKAAVRYLRYFDNQILGDAEKIVTDGTSAGGAMSSLLGATGNNPAYEPMLEAMGAAPTRDDVFASVCFCPIIDLEHADMAYEWLYGCTNAGIRGLNDEQKAVSAELAAMYPEYLHSLNLTNPTNGEPLTAENYLDYMKQFLIASAQEAKDAGAELLDTIGITYSRNQEFQAPINGGIGRPDEHHRPPHGMPPMGERRGAPHGRMPMPDGFGRNGETIVDIDLSKYLPYVVSTVALKTPPAFDSQGVIDNRASGENEEFGDDTGSSVNFTNYSLRKASGNATAEIDASIAENVRLLNPMRMMDDAGSTIAKHWYIRHGARDRDTAFPVPINLATKLMNKQLDVNFKLPWNRPHMGDYALNEMFDWIKEVTK